MVSSLQTVMESGFQGAPCPRRRLKCPAHRGHQTSLGQEKSRGECWSEVHFPRPHISSRHEATESPSVSGTPARSWHGPRHTGATQEKMGDVPLILLGLMDRLGILSKCRVRFSRSGGGG